MADTLDARYPIRVVAVMCAGREKRFADENFTLADKAADLAVVAERQLSAAAAAGQSASANLSRQWR